MAKILLVDDSLELLEFLSIFLQMRSYEVQTASEKGELQSKMLVFSPDLILLDVKLNGHDGRELCKQIKENSPSPKIPIIILLSASHQLLASYEECHADDTVSKPFELEEIEKKIQYNLSKNKN